MTTPKRHRSSRIPGWLAAAVVLVSSAFPALAGEAILVGGTGSGSRLLQALVDEYHRSGGSAEIVVIDPPLGSGAGIKGVKAGRLHMAISARRLEGEERNGELVEIEYARTPFVFATLDGKRSEGFSLKDLADVYAGRLNRWDNGDPIRLILRPSFDADTMFMRTMSPGLDRAVTLALERKGMVTASSDMEAAQLIAQTPGSLGSTTLGLIRLMNIDVRVFPIAGREPSAEALAREAYPWFKNLYLVTLRRPRQEVQTFLDFLVSPRAAELLLRTGHLPASHGK